MSVGNCYDAGDDVVGMVMLSVFVIMMVVLIVLVGIQKRLCW